MLKNSICRRGISGYPDFENAVFYSDKADFDVAKFWWTTASIRAVPVILCFFATVILIKFLKSLWLDNTKFRRGDDATGADLR